MTDWKHDALANDLAAHLRGYARPAMIWTNMQLGPAGSPRPDVYSIEPTYTRLVAMAYEIKVSRSDFLADAQKGKALGYLNYAGAVVFAAPKGLLTKAEIPAGCGLIERGDEAWRWAKKPIIQPIKTLPFEAWMKLLIDGRSRDIGIGTPPSELRIRHANKYAQQDRARKKLGDDLALLLSDRDRARDRLEREIEKLDQESAVKELTRKAREQAQEQAAHQHVAAIKKEVAEITLSLGLGEEAQTHEVLSALRALRPDADAARNQRLAYDLRRAVYEIERAIKTLAPAKEGETS